MSRRVVVRWLGAACVAAMICAVAGCGQSEEEFLTSDANVICEMVADVAGAVSDPARFESIFATGAVPPESERAKYGAPNMYEAGVEDVSISGDTATINVTVTSAEDDSVIGEVTWTAVKEDNRWKLKEAPLPAGS